MKKITVKSKKEIILFCLTRCTARVNVLTVQEISNDLISISKDSYTGFHRYKKKLWKFETIFAKTIFVFNIGFMR